MVVEQSFKSNFHFEMLFNFNRANWFFLQIKNIFSEERSSRMVDGMDFVRSQNSDIDFSYQFGDCYLSV